MGRMVCGQASAKWACSWGYGVVRRRDSSQKAQPKALGYTWKDHGNRFHLQAWLPTGHRITLEPGRCFHMRRTRHAVVAHGYRWDDAEIDEAMSSQFSFADGVRLFNSGDYYSCHDVLEGLWNDAREPQRSILHGILQCAVALYHLLNQNHRGAMVELGEGLNKLRKMQFKEGPLQEFEQDFSAVLEFLYSTQLENAACGDESCVTMDGSEMSYRLLGNFGAGSPLYSLQLDKDGTPLSILFVPKRLADDGEDIIAAAAVRVKLPRLSASEEDLYRYF